MREELIVVLLHPATWYLFGIMFLYCVVIAAIIVVVGGWLLD